MRPSKGNLRQCYKRRLVRASTALSLVALIVVGGATLARTINEPIRVEGSLLQGTVEEGLTIYRGIPYPAPPVGDLRWRAPQPVPKWNGVRMANERIRTRMHAIQCGDRKPACSF